MAPHAIISYDDTQNDHDALALGRTLRDAGARLTLAYVRHSTQRRPDEEELSQHEAEALLERGALSLDDQSIQRRVVMSASTGEGLGWLAAQEQADIIVFGSDYRTRRGHVAMCRSAQTLLERGATAVAIAPAGYAAAGDGRSPRSACCPAPPTRRRSRPRSRWPSESVRPWSTPTAASICSSSAPAAEAREGRVMITSRRGTRSRRRRRRCSSWPAACRCGFETLVTA